MTTETTSTGTDLQRTFGVPQNPNRTMPRVRWRRSHADAALE